MSRVSLTCPCGAEFLVWPSKAKRAKYCSKACFYRYREGCGAPTSHGYGGHPLYHTWTAMVARCHKERTPGYQNYGGRGIKVTEAWRESPAPFIEWIEANLGARPEGHTLDRIDVDGDYEPGNLRWADASQQQRNTRARGATRTRDGKKWRSQFMYRGKITYLGTFDTEEAARAAYLAARKEVQDD